MYDKQLGTAPEAKPEPLRADGRFSRLRARPGFRTASVAFLLTVILGVGGPAAHAYWSQSAAVTVTGETVTPVTPTPTGVSCQKTAPYQVKWSASPGADPEARYVVTFQAYTYGQPRSVSYALASGTLSANPSAFDLGSVFGYTASAPLPMTATVTSAIVRSGVSAATVKVTDEDLVHVSADSGPANYWYSSSFREGIRFACR